MKQERDTLKKIIGNINKISGEIFKKNQYFDSFEDEIKSSEIKSEEKINKMKPKFFKKLV